MKLDKINDIFEVSYGTKLDMNKMSISENSDIAFISRSSKHNGLVGFVDKYNDLEPIEPGCITVTLGGTYLLSSFLQEIPFYTAQNVAILNDKYELSKEQKLYYCMCITANRYKYAAFGREANRSLKYLKVPSIKEIPEWVNTVNTDRYHDLSRPEIDANIDIDLNNFPLCELQSIFEVLYGTNMELNKLTQDKSGIHFVSRTSTNNGVSAKVLKTKNKNPIDGYVLSVAGGGSVLETFVQFEPFYSGRDLFYLKPKRAMSIEEMFFYATCIKANKYRYSYGRQANRTLKFIKLPDIFQDEQERKKVNEFMKTLNFSSAI